MNVLNHASTRDILNNVFRSTFLLLAQTQVRILQKFLSFMPPRCRVSHFSFNFKFFFPRSPNICAHSLFFPSLFRMYNEFLRSGAGEHSRLGAFCVFSNNNEIRLKSISQDVRDFLSGEKLSRFPEWRDAWMGFFVDFNSSKIIGSRVWRLPVQTIDGCGWIINQMMRKRRE